MTLVVLGFVALAAVCIYLGETAPDEPRGLPSRPGQDGTRP